jgi:hypothetical protein
MKKVLPLAVRDMERLVHQEKIYIYHKVESDRTFVGLSVFFTPLQCCALYQ